MSKKILVLLESPGKIKKVSQIFNSFNDGNLYTVKASMGHISRIADEGKYNTGIDLETFEEKYEILPEKKEIVKELKQAVKDSDLVYMASDGDREGSAISYHWTNFLNIPKSKQRRLIFHEITEKGIKDGILNMTPSYDEKEVQAARCRAELDKLEGYRLSGFSRSKIGALSAGRVQSAALKIICDKEKEIQAFIPEDYFEIWLPLIKNEKELKAKYVGTNKKKIQKINDEKEVNKIKADCEKNKYIVKSITFKERLSNPKDAFTTSTLQQAASTSLGFSPKKTMTTAQKLYEMGHISYMRSDSVRLSDDFVAECKDKIEKDYGNNYWKGFSSKVKGSAQDGHEGIRPTHLEDIPSKLSSKLGSEQLKLYKLIYNRTLASLMTPAKIKDTEVGIYNGEHKFSVVGHEIIFDGYMKVYNEIAEGETEESNQIITGFEEKEIINNKPLEVNKKTTQPPNRYSEAGIVKALENYGIGRPSTFMPTVETLKDREYIQVEKKSIKPTLLGMNLSELLDKYFPTIINIEFTAQMEEILDKISKGELNRVDELKKFWDNFNPLVLKANREANKDKEPPKKTGRSCPQCGADLVIRKTKDGTKEFIACSKFPKCKFTESLEKKELPTLTNILCPVCKKGYMVERKSKKGEIFYGCSEFYKGCKGTMKKEEFDKLNETK